MQLLLKYAIPSPKSSLEFSSMQLIVSLLSIFLLTSCTNPITKPAKNETAMERVQKAGKIRCSYLPYSCYFKKDPNTGQMSGIFYDLMEEIGKNSGLKIEWTEEVGYQNMFPGLDSDRYDAFCGGLWPNAIRAKAATFSKPAFYSKITAWSRPNDTRFEKNLTAANSSDIKIAVIDGAMEDLIARTDFPKANRLSLPDLSPFTQNYLNVVHKKADVTFAEPMIMNEFLAANPKALKEIQPDKPLRIFGNCLAVKKGEFELKEFFDIALEEIINDGRMNKILKKYQPDNNTFYPVSVIK